MQISADATKAEIAHGFVPELLVNYIQRNVRNGKEKVEPASFFVNGVCLLVDISGFTMMSERFCVEGKGGIDNLQLTTNGYMGQLVDVIYSFGGDIIKFAGDALVCLFANSDLIAPKNARKSVNSTGMVDVVLQAMMCAHAIRGVKTDTLSVHVAMSCGEMCFGILGGVENRWECLISGPCIHQLSDCLDDAPSTQAAITPECLNVLKGHALQDMDLRSESKEEDAEVSDAVQNWVVTTTKGRFEATLLPMPSGNQRIVDVKFESSTPNHEVNEDALMSPRVLLTSSRQKTVIDALIRQFVPAPIVEELDSATGLSYFAEIREVTTMFMKVRAWLSSDSRGVCSFQYGIVPVSCGRTCRAIICPTLAGSH
jgi:hypothetical protein